MLQAPLSTHERSSLGLWLSSQPAPQESRMGLVDSLLLAMSLLSNLMVVFEPLQLIHLRAIPVSA